jgi:hypothetical protein
MINALYKGFRRMAVNIADIVNTILPHEAAIIHDKIFIF